MLEYVTNLNNKKAMKCIIVCLSLIVVSCDFPSIENKEAVNKKSNFSKLEKDTIIAYELVGISTEGAVSKVNYVNGKIIKSNTSIYGETGQAKIIYEFQVDKIKVFEAKYSYKSTLENVKSEEDMLLDYETSYFIDFDGNLLGEEAIRIDIFKEFKAVVPFEI